MLKQLNKFEKIWYVSFMLIIVVITVYNALLNTDYTNLYSIFINLLLSPVSAITGIVCVLLAAQGKTSNYIWGFVNCFTYAYLAFISGYYGDTILNIFWFVPTQVIGYFMWRRNLDEGSKTDVKMKKLKWQSIVIILIVCILFTICLGLLLTNIDNWLTRALKINSSIYQNIYEIFNITYLGEMLDASTETLQITATILMLLAYREQWLLWIMTNVISILLWILVLISNISSISYVLPVLIMWIAYFVNSIYGYVKWSKGNKEVVVNV